MLPPKWYMMLEQENRQDIWSSVHQCMRGVEGSTQYTPIAGCLALGRQTRSGVAESPALA